MASEHVPVLLEEVIGGLQVAAGKRFIDCTLGRAGHTAAILERGGQVLGIDADPEAIAAVRDMQLPGLTLVQAHFDELAELARELGPVDGVLFDLGVSSPQLENGRRGFSLAQEGPLDMRFDPTQGDAAERLVNEASMDELTRILRDYGEEPQARRMARAIESARPVLSTTRLATVIERAAGGRGRIHPATRIFQALRIATNQELERLESALEQTTGVLKPGGRLVVIAFHSLEDRIVKDFMAREARDCICPPRTPVCVCGHQATLRAITRKPIAPGPAEMARNPRARSAKLRVAERI